MYVYNCDCCGVSDYCVSFSGITTFTLELFHRNKNNIFSLSSMSSDFYFYFDILLNQQAYRLFENKKNICFVV